jgi:hypothetical protein
MGKIGDHAGIKPDRPEWVAIFPIVLNVTTEGGEHEY